MLWRIYTPFAAFALLAAPVAAQDALYPMPGMDNPRIQTLEWREGSRIVITALPQTALTVVLEPGENIRRVTLSDDASWDINVSPEFDSFQVVPAENARNASLIVESNQRNYTFALQTGSDLTAAYLVRLIYQASAVQQVASDFIDEDSDTTRRSWSYRMRGDRTVRPQSISDDGYQTVIEYAPGQSLPAVFAKGASGKEEVVDGYMREGRFIIDRVHAELVFRIDKEKATAKRNSQADEEAL